jgi:hypothetical protein
LKASEAKKLARPHLNQQLGVMVCVCHPSCMGSINRKIVVQACPSPKITKMKGDWGVDQVVEHLLSSKQP